MTSSQLESSWAALKGKLKQRYGQLTDDDLAFADGKAEELLSRLQVKLSISREELDSTLDDLASVHATLDQVKAKAGEISDQLRAKAVDVVEDLRDRALEIGEDAKSQGAAAYTEASQRVRGLWKDGEDYVRAKPRESLVTAAVAGFVAGIVLLRR